MRLAVDITKRLGSFCLRVAFACEDGVLGILGASGCGKSMTLKCIDQPAPAEAACGLSFPKLCALSQHDGAAEHPLRPAR